MSDGFAKYNPFARRESHGTGAVTTYKVLTTVTWLLSLIVSIYYTVQEPRDGYTIRRRIWDLNALHRTAFTMNAAIAEIFWAVLFILQAGYIASLFSRKTETVNAAASVGSHFILNNLLHFAFVMLFVRGHYVVAEVMLVINFFNLTSLYSRHSAYARYIHMPVVSAPLAWTYVAIFWNGAIMVYHPDNLVARIFGNVFIWSFLLYGMFYIIAYKDYTMGFTLSVLTAAIGVAQFVDKIIALQWIFSFTIMAVLFVFTLVVAVPAWQGREFSFRRAAPQADTERAPLLGEN